MALGEHGVGLADARGRAQVDAKTTGCLDLRGGIGARLRGVAHVLAGCLGAGATCLPGDLGGLLLISPGRPDRCGAAGSSARAGPSHSGSAFGGTEWRLAL